MKKKYARLYYDKRTYNLGSFETKAEVAAARAGAMAMLKRIQSEAYPPPAPRLSEPRTLRPDEVADRIKTSVLSGKLDPFLDELDEVVKRRAFMLKNLPKQVMFGRPVIKPRSGAARRARR